MTQKAPGYTQLSSAIAGASAATLLFCAKLLLMLLTMSFFGYAGLLLAQKIAVVTNWAVEAANYLASGMGWVMSFTIVAKLAEYAGPLLYTIQPIITMAGPALTPIHMAVPIVVSSIPGGRIVTASISLFIAAATVCFRSNTNAALLP